MEGDQTPSDNQTFPPTRQRAGAIPQTPTPAFTMGGETIVETPVTPDQRLDDLTRQLSMLQTVILADRQEPRRGRGRELKFDHPPVFSGLATEYRAWKRSLNIYIHGQPGLFESDAQIIFYASSRLTETAAEWRDEWARDHTEPGVPLGHNWRWREYEQDMDSTFANPAEKQEARQKLTNIRMMPGKYEEYLSEFQGLRAISGFSDDAVIFLFLNGLPFSWRTEIERSSEVNLMSLPSVLDKSRRIHQSHLFEQARRASNPTTAPTPNVAPAGFTRYRGRGRGNRLGGGVGSFNPNYDPNKKCDIHGWGHSNDECFTQRRQREEAGRGRGRPEVRSMEKEDRKDFH